MFKKTAEFNMLIYSYTYNIFSKPPVSNLLQLFCVTGCYDLRDFLKLVSLIIFQPF
jgi:hypothetical protein